MANSRPAKPRGKGMGDPPRSVYHNSFTFMHRLPLLYSRPAWQTGAKPSPSFSPASLPPRLPPANQGSFPPLAAQTNGSRLHDSTQQDRILPALSGLTVRSHSFLARGIPLPTLLSRARLSPCPPNLLSGMRLLYCLPLLRVTLLVSPSRMSKTYPSPAHHSKSHYSLPSLTSTLGSLVLPTPRFPMATVSSATFYTGYSSHGMMP